MANAPYGKLAQGVMGQRGWDAWAQERDAVGGSAITSPWHASMTTGLVRAVLLATLNQLHDLGYSTPSCTTDGFIDRKSTRLNSSHVAISYAVFCLKKKKISSSQRRHKMLDNTR